MKKLFSLILFIFWVISVNATNCVYFTTSKYENIVKPNEVGECVVSGYRGYDFKCDHVTANGLTNDDIKVINFTDQKTSNNFDAVGKTFKNIEVILMKELDNNLIDLKNFEPLKNLKFVVFSMNQVKIKIDEVQKDAKIIKIMSYKNHALTLTNQNTFKDILMEKPKNKLFTINLLFIFCVMQTFAIVMMLLYLIRTKGRLATANRRVVMMTNGRQSDVRVDEVIYDEVWE
jgi:hypothetical protein